MKIISWNVNGIRAVIKKGFYDFMNEYNPDIICIQETKAHKDQVNLELENYPYQYWNSAQKKGYSGVAIFSKKEPIKRLNDINYLYKDKNTDEFIKRLAKNYDNQPQIIFSRRTGELIEKRKLHIH